MERARLAGAGFVPLWGGGLLYSVEGIVVCSGARRASNGSRVRRRAAYETEFIGMSDAYRERWNARYRSAPLVWGAEPNRFVVEAFGRRPAQGRALDLGCGEGRNALWLARRGWRVTGVDLSDVAIERARARAESESHGIEWVRANIIEYEAEAQAFDLVLVSYLHLPAPERREVLRLAAGALVPGGELFLIGHARRNLEEGVGGPPDATVLWEPVEIEAELRALELRVERCTQVLRAVEGADPTRPAIDLLARARRPTSR